jgi:Tfp pilus assembly protein PilF
MGFLVAVVAGSTGCPRPSGDPAKSEKRLDLARDALANGDLDTAEQESNRALGLHPGNEEALNLRGMVHELRAAGVLRLIEVDDCLTGVDAEALRSQFDEYLDRADVDFARAVELAPDFGEAWFNRGVVANLREEPDQAVVMLSRALEHPERLLNPAMTRAQLGWAHFHRSDFVAATKELLQALQFQPGMCWASYRLGRVYFAREEWEKAAEQFQGVIDDPSCKLQEAHLFLMKARTRQGLVDDARSAADGCVSIEPRSCLALQCRAEHPDGSSAP